MSGPRIGFRLPGSSNRPSTMVPFEFDDVEVEVFEVAAVFVAVPAVLFEELPPPLVVPQPTTATANTADNPATNFHP